MEASLDSLSDNLGETVTDRLKQRIRAEILAGRMQPGVRMKLADIANRFHVSQMPVREALGQLSSEGLIVLLPNKGASVRPVDRQFILNMYDVRAALEGMLARRVAERVDAAQAAQLRELASAYARAAGRGDLPKMVQANRVLHRQITLLADNPEALRLLDQGWELIFSFRLRHGPTPRRIEQIVQEHAALVDAIQAGDGEKAETVARQHSMHARDDLLGVLNMA